MCEPAREPRRRRAHAGEEREQEGLVSGRQGCGEGVEATAEDGFLWFAACQQLKCRWQR
jgi:hypothetical protein